MSETVSEQEVAAFDGKRDKNPKKTHSNIPL